MSTSVLSTSAATAATAATNKDLYSPCYSPLERYSLQGLIRDVKQHLGESGGISSDDVDSQYLISLAQKYISDPSDWISYFYNDPSKNYTRNAIENINHKANIVSRPLTSSISIYLIRTELTSSS